MRRLIRPLARVTAVAALTVAMLMAPGPAAYAEDTACTDTPPDTRELADSRGPLPQLLRYADTHRLATGRGIGVAVIDTGVAPGATGAGSITVRESLAAPGVSPGIVDSHGTLVAGLVAGRNEEGAALGVAPGTHVVSIKVADARRDVLVDRGDSGLVPLTPAQAAAGIRRAIELRDVLGIRVVNLSLNFEAADPFLATVVRNAVRNGLVVVAAVGNRPTDAQGKPRPEDAYEVGEEAVQFPATVPGVIAVTGLAPDGTLDPSLVQTGSHVDVAAPVHNAVTVNVGGTTCLIQSSGTSWAAAQVSGLAALVLERFGRGLTPAQVEARIAATASGALQDSALDGHGTIQPYEALTAELDIAADGTMARPSVFEQSRREVAPPPLEVDEFASSRRSLVWWGLGAGGVLVTALLLRPLLRRRR